MKPILRRYQAEDDYWQIREFLRTVFLLNDRRMISWHVARLDYWRCHGIANLEAGSFEEHVFLWETPERQIIAVLNREDAGHAFLQVHPGLRTAELETEMLDLAEERLAKESPDGRELWVWMDSQDTLRGEILTQRGYSQGQWVERQWWRDLDTPIPDVPVTQGYTVRSLGDGLELLERCYASGLAFHENDLKIAADNRDDPTWYRNIQAAPLYRRDLDLVAVAPDGAVASFCTIWFDDVTRSACFEPVAAVPAHQRRGLGKAVMTEGLRRLQRIGARRAFVVGGSVPANALYASVMGPHFDLWVSWTKKWPGSQPISE